MVVVHEVRENGVSNAREIALDSLISTDMALTFCRRL